MISDREIDRVGTAIGLAYRQGTLVPPDIDLQPIGSAADAAAVQDAAAAAHGGERVGHSLAATTPITARLLGCDGPVSGPVFADRVMSSGDTLRPRPSILGIGAQLTFVFGRNLEPEEGLAGDLASLAGAVASCHLSLQVLGRRVPHAMPLNAVRASADLGLVEALVQGPLVPDWQARLRPDMEVRLRLDGHVCATGMPSDAMGDPLAPVAWLVRNLSGSGNLIEAGDSVATGSVTGLLQIRPGQVVTADFGDLGTVKLLVA